MKRETEDRKAAKAQVEERRRKLLEEKKAKQEELLRKDYERKERKQKQKMMGERWAMARWISSYIDENNDRWIREKSQRKKTDLERAEEWKKMKRFEKIALMREKIEEKKANLSLAFTIKPAKISLKADQAEQEPGQAEQKEEKTGEGDSVERHPGDHHHADHHAESPGGADGEPDTTILQPLAIMRVLPRWDKFQAINNPVPLLTSKLIGKRPGTECQAEIESPQRAGDEPQTKIIHQEDCQADPNDPQREEKECQAETAPGDECQAELTTQEECQA